MTRDEWAKRPLAERKVAAEGFCRGWGLKDGNFLADGIGDSTVVMAYALDLPAPPAVPTEGRETTMRSAEEIRGTAPVWAELRQMAWNDSDEGLNIKRRDDKGEPDYWVFLGSDGEWEEQLEFARDVAKTFNLPLIVVTWDEENEDVEVVEYDPPERGRGGQVKDPCEKCEHWPFVLKAAHDRDVDNLAHAVDYCRNCARCARRALARVAKLERLIVEAEEGKKLGYLKHLRDEAARIKKEKR